MKYPLVFGCVLGHIEMVKLLLNNAEHCSDSKSLAICAAPAFGKDDIIRELLSCDHTLLKAIDVHGNSPLPVAYNARK